MARILLYTLVFSPDGVSTAQLLTELAAELQAAGNEMTVLTTTPHFNVDIEARARQPLGRRWGRLLQESRCGSIPVYHVRIRDKGNRVLSRLLDYAVFHVVSVVAGAVLGVGYDVILAPSPPLTIGIGAWLIGLMRRAPFVYNVQEIFPDVAIRLGVLRNHSLVRLLYWLERFTYRRARRVVVISEWFRRDLLAKGVPTEKLVVIPNFVDTDFIRPLPRHNRFSSLHGLEDRFVVLYAGNLGLTQGLEAVLEAAASLAEHPDIRFLLAGDGARRAWLEREVAARGLPNVTLLPYQPRSAVPEMYATSDVCLVPLKGGTARDTFPSKIYTIMAAGRPAIACADEDSELAWVVHEARCGFAIPPDDAGALAAAVIRALNARQDLAVMGQRGRDYVISKHGRAAVATSYDALIREVVAEEAR
jgi:colanic acid biosynthesis glycosyl transferase WcaI